MAQAEGPALSGPEPGLPEPKRRGQETWPGRAGQPFASGWGLPLHAPRAAGGLCRSGMGKLVLNFSFSFYPVGCVLCCRMKTNER